MEGRTVGYRRNGTKSKLKTKVMVITKTVNSFNVSISQQRGKRMRLYILAVDSMKTVKNEIATEVDHIIPLVVDYSLRLDPGNLQGYVLMSSKGNGLGYKGRQRSGTG